MSRRPARAGYVLVEALATLAIAGLVIAVLAGLAGALLRAGHRGAELVEQHERVARSIDVVARDIDALVRARWAGEGDFMFVGRADRLMFVRRNADQPGELVAVAYQIADDTRLLRAEAAAPTGLTGLTQLRFGASRELVAPFGAWRLAYVEQRPTGDEAMLANWDPPDAVPAAIVIALMAKDGTALAVRRLPVRAEVEPACARSTNSRTPSAYCSLGGRRVPPAAAANQPGGQP